MPKRLSVDRRGIPIKDVVVWIGLLVTLTTALGGLVRAGITIGSQQQMIGDLVRRVTDLELEQRYLHGTVAVPPSKE